MKLNAEIKTAFGTFNIVVDDTTKPDSIGHIATLLYAAARLYDKESLPCMCEDAWKLAEQFDEVSEIVANLKGE